MKKWLICVVCLMVLLTGCSADPDTILLDDVTEEAGSVMEEDSVSSSREDAEGEPGLAGDASAATDVNDEAAQNQIYVYICGAVTRSGVYELPEGSRVFQLVEEAGGFTEEADQAGVNLANTLMDGQMIRIPAKGEEPLTELTASGQTDTSGTQAADGLININTASAQELTSLSGIGEAKAEAIVAYREQHGAFQSTEEIMQVDGIAEGTYQKLKDKIKVK